jgi:hypothetical protein
LDIQFLFAIQALGLLGTKCGDLRCECSYSGGHRIVWNRPQHNVVTMIFDEDRSGVPSLANRSGHGHLATTGYRKPLCHGHDILP